MNVGYLQATGRRTGVGKEEGKKEKNAKIREDRGQEARGRAACEQSRPRVKEARATRAMGKRNANSRPRAVGGGRSARYDERRGARGSQKQYAAEWSDASAAVVLQQLQRVCKTHEESLLSGTLKILQSDELERSFLRELRGKLSPHDEGIATDVLALHRERVRAAGAEDKGRKALVKSFLKPLRERASATHTHTNTPEL